MVLCINSETGDHYSPIVESFLLSRYRSVCWEVRFYGGKIFAE